MCGYKPFMPLERFRPTYSIKFCHIVNATRTDESHRFIAGMVKPGEKEISEWIHQNYLQEWNQERNLKLMKKAPRWYPPSMLPYTEENKVGDLFPLLLAVFQSIPMPSFPPSDVQCLLCGHQPV
jgi:hypothetical protein